MQLKLRKSKSSTGKERIVFVFTPDKDKTEQKVMRSIASVNVGKHILLRHDPLIEFKFEGKIQKTKKFLAPENTRPEVLGAAKLNLAMDEEEYASALSAVRTRALAKTLGIKIPKAIAKKFNCRCGLVYIDPSEFISHRKICYVLHVSSSDILTRVQTIIDRDKIIPPPKKQKETFPCRCGYDFPTKRMCVNHQKLCSILKECTELFARCKDYLDRNKDESSSSRQRKPKIKCLEFKLPNKSAKRKLKRKRLSKRSVS